MTVVHSGYGGLSILAIDSEMRIVDNDLNVYDTFETDSAFLDPLEIIKSFIKRTIEYYKDCKWKQFMRLELKAFAQSNFVRETIRYVREEQ